MGSKITSQQVAERAGVSQSAVSRVFTPGASASEKTAAKVRKAAAELGYRPNILARSLITGKSRIIGLVVAYLENQFYPEAMERLSRRLQEEGYHILVFLSNNDDAVTGGVIDELLDYQVDGIITASVSMSSDLTARCEAAGIPIVLFNRQQDDERLSCVRSDNVAGGRKVADLLLRAGHRKIAYIAGWEGASTQRDREAGFLKGLADGGQELFARGEGRFSYDAAAEAARDMFTRSDRPDAVFVANDHMAFAVMDVLRFKLGLRIPEDVSVVGYDDVQLAAWPAYDLTTVRQPANRMVAATVDILLTRINNPESDPRRVAIDGPLILRGSSRKHKGQTT
ncbi:LacI family DNA-binding transcriptional regulator [Sedimentitalea todarodis]|uniref:LacI family DNA-binding transcriptional regulator n=1 Tax=Sedimentitalea todarodis TaxID=1631240 RepID=A0ABU3VE10_9RHOB|nr:LacI family DNA-binding transcriptional regulator [Sedimentitalea todarodis]MDU9004422.1 LacI family DNA-binding transcriptional regulator [Sedimentitalea todarodis]